MAARRVLVTGVSSGIGRRTALALDRAGFEVWGTVRSERDVGRLMVDREHRIRPVRLELTDPGSIDRAAEQVTAAGPLYGLVNGAGAAIPEPMELVEDRRVEELLRVNVLGPLRLTQRLLPALRQGRSVSGSARVIFVGSSITRIPLPMFGPYGTCKHALVGLTDSLRAELAPERIKVILAEPVVFATSIWARAARDAAELRARGGDDRYAALIAAAAPTARLAYRYGQPPEQAAQRLVRLLTVAGPPPRIAIGRYARLVGALFAVTPERVKAAVSAAPATSVGGRLLRWFADRAAGPALDVEDVRG